MNAVRTMILLAALALASCGEPGTWGRDHGYLTAGSAFDVTVGSRFDQASAALGQRGYQIVERGFGRRCGRHYAGSIEEVVAFRHPSRAPRPCLMLAHGEVIAIGWDSPPAVP